MTKAHSELTGLFRSDEAAGVAEQLGFSSIEDAQSSLEAMAQAAGLGPRLVAEGPDSEASPPAEQEIRHGVVVLDEGLRIRALDEESERMFGCRTSDVLDEPASRLFASPAWPDGPFRSLRRKGSRAALETAPDVCARLPGGATFPLEMSCSSIASGAQTQFILVVRDRAEGLRADARRRSMENRFRSLVEHIPAITFMAALNDDHPEFYVSPQIGGLLGFSAEEWLGNPFLWFTQIHPEDRIRWNQEFTRGCIEGGPFRSEFRALTRDGRTVWVHGEGRIVRDSTGFPSLIQGVAFDITENKLADEKVKQSLDEKVVLLKEIHHRVKNNLQVISSLLKLQSAKIKDPHALAMFQESQDRVRSMALLHDKLCQSDDMAAIDFADYVRNLSALLFRSYSASASRVRLVIDVGDVRLGLDTAVPAGLILNELMSNALKYAFPEGKAGELHVRLHPLGGDYELHVWDTGVGMPRDFDLATAKSLGMRLIHTLSDQLGGKPILTSETGTDYRLVFPRHGATR